ncbi:multidrug effflux MFS transporter [Myroides odoratimimus]|uniref:MFS transporter n=3 Tax=Myroides odoratimimus TaxID=76832 RepID=A0A0U3GQI3_9FLAO|nr:MULTISPECIES: multidrug effflux MFS transporter [Myroides]AJA67664.1 drug resistance transporter, Bcr/CflA subfamily [Myroides sp. A21]ALU24959.1 MFS transporter [Myroides odoratimimus]EHO05830.1 drug resistance transporter, Bcr/CflA subfamily [Myroides odoratimimus CCUG 10230]EHO06346.1 drug resistance transporter, Bcr/CflA subfamily [Myroides odoratimimus CIP 101113]MDM1059862.1 multidrug effflux MFS transporter [Myroides odoratimimus]
MKTKNSLALMIVLMMFPQFVETIYSPALTHLAKAFDVTKETTLLTISIYFIAFALGVIFWGILSDYIGRRKAMLSGLITYTLASVLALLATNFETILIARFIAAFGIAVGSVITQTMMRDSYTGVELAKVFSIMGIALSVSPVIGLLMGGILSNQFGYWGVFTVLATLSILLVSTSFFSLKETKQHTDKITLDKIIALAKTMYTDSLLWKYALLVMAYNVLLFSYYSFAPFIFEQEGLSPTVYGYSGIVLAVGSFIGSSLNKKLLERGYLPIALMKIAATIAIVNALVLILIGNTLYFLIPMVFIVTAFGIAIPNILSQALLQYKSSIGTASALFGLLYYILIGTGLYISSTMPNITVVMISFATIAILVSLLIKSKKATL